MTRRPLPGLGLRATRVRLLAWSYEDAAFGSDDGGRGSKPGSRALSRNLELWNAGSYHDLEQAVDRLALCHRRVFRAEHMTAPQPFRSREWMTLVKVAALMPPHIFVPADISEAAGYLPSEAKVYARPRRVAA